MTVLTFLALCSRTDGALLQFGDHQNFAYTFENPRLTVELHTTGYSLLHISETRYFESVECSCGRTGNGMDTDAKLLFIKNPWTQVLSGIGSNVILAYIG